MEKNSVLRLEHSNLCQKPSTMKLTTTVVFLLVIIWSLWPVWSSCWVKLGYLFIYVYNGKSSCCATTHNFHDLLIYKCKRKNATI